MTAVATAPKGVTAERKSLAKIKDTTSFYEHQTSGIRMMARMNSFLLADEMGLGKTVQALTVAAIDYELGHASRTIIVTPASLKWNWSAEIETFTNFSHVILDGTLEARSKQIANFGADILILGYEQLRTHIAEINALGFDIAIFDEAHYMKSPKAKRTLACLNLYSKRSFLITGSPMLNHVDDLWSLLHRISPVDYPNYWTFLHRHAVYGGYKDKQIVGIKNAAELTERLDRVMIRRYKKDVLDLPEKQVITVMVDLHPEQRKLYDQANDEMRLDLPGDPNPMEIENAMVKFLRHKQICGTTAAIPGYPDHSFKLDRAVEMVQEIVASGDPVVVFTQFRAVQAAMLARLSKVGIPTSHLNGDTPQKDRVAVVNHWAAANGGAMVAMIQVAGVGLNMTAASSAIFLDRLFSPKLNEQAEDRLHRIGAGTRPVQIFNLLCRDTIESRIEQILRRKKKFFSELVDETAWKRELIKSLKEDS